VLTGTERLLRVNVARVTSVRPHRPRVRATKSGANEHRRVENVERHRPFAPTDDERARTVVAARNRKYSPVCIGFPSVGSSG
jgi:hypothetical protein